LHSVDHISGEALRDTTRGPQDLPALHSVILSVVTVDMRNKVTNKILCTGLVYTS